MTNEMTWEQGVSRREFVKLGSAGAGLSLLALNGCASKSYLEELADGTSVVSYDAWEDIYRKQWQWDSVSWGSHNNQCLPSGCSFRVYSKNGIVWREEQSAKAHASNDNYPDFNPLGCQKGCGFHSLLYSEERLRYPMRRAGERGEGKWQRISWDEALTDIADAILDAHEDVGPGGFHLDAPHVHAGTAAWGGAARMTAMLGGLAPDFNVEIGDDLKGISHVFGKMRMGFSADNLMDAELLIFTHTNWAYTAPPIYHFITEARYNGSEIVLLSPDFSASGVHADIHIPVKAAADSAFWLGVCQEILTKEWHNKDFVREQTDLAMLVRTDNQKFLTAEDMDGGRPDQLYFYDLDINAVAEAPQGTLLYGGTQALEGRWEVTLRSGEAVQVEPSMARLKRDLDKNYTPEQAAKICGLKPSVIRTMAKKVSTKRTHLYIGFTSAKHYHGDLMERSALLAMGLTGNWGKPGTGTNNFIAFADHGEFLFVAKNTVANGGLHELHEFESLMAKQILQNDPHATREQVGNDIMAELVKKFGWMPPSLWMYKHAGYSQLWDKPEWQDQALGKTFGDYFREGVERGFVDDSLLETTPQVLMYMAHNPLRRQRSGRRMYTENLWPKAKMIFSIETRMSSSAAYADIVLPAAWYYEKEDMTASFGFLPFISMQEKAVKPPGEARAEWEIFVDLMAKISERASARGMTEYVDNMGLKQAYADLHNNFTMGGELLTNLDVLKEFVAFNVATGIMPKDYTFEKFKEDGTVRVQSMGAMHQRETQAGDVLPDKPFYAMGWNVEKKLPYATHTRRAQFYMDHDWFIEAGEALPVHKDLPPIGGMHPYSLISGHPRISVHTLHQMTPMLMRLHRGQPVAFINTAEAARRGIRDGDKIRMYNDYDSSELMVSTAAGVGPDQIAVYMWEPNQFKDWKSHDAMLIGMPKGLHLAMDYKQLRHRFFVGSPNPTGDRALRVNFEKIPAHDGGEFE